MINFVRVKNLDIRSKRAAKPHWKVDNLKREIFLMM